MTKKRFNLMDVLIAVLVVAVLAGGAFMLAPRTGVGAAAKRTDIEFDVLATDLTSDEAESIKNVEGTEVIYGVGRADKGILKKVVIEPYIRLGEDVINGRVIPSTHPENFQVIMTISATVTETDDAFIGAKEEVRVGKGLPILGKGFAASWAFIIDMREETK